jgi:transitional endoplasmic reticulum ATPase
VPRKRGLILHGVPGNGKTISIKALISALYERNEPVPSLYVKSFDARNGRNNSIRNIFTQARRMASCLLIFEDLDSLVTETTRSYFLNEVDGLESNDGILMIGSTNYLEQLDPAISKRPSRFDRKYHFKMPEEDERIAYCQYWRNKLATDGGMLDFPAEVCNVIAKMTEGFSFAYLKELFVNALLMVAHDGAGDAEEAEIPVMVRRENAVEQKATEGEMKEGEGHEDAEPAPKKRTIPEVDTPAFVKDNLLLKVVRAHLKTLLDEMDNTKEEDWSSSKTQAGGDPGAAKPARVARG